MTQITPSPTVLLIASDQDQSNEVQALLGATFTVVCCPAVDQAIERLESDSLSPSVVVLSLAVDPVQETPNAWLDDLARLMAHASGARFLLAGRDLPKSKILDAVEHGVVGILEEPFSEHREEWRVLIQQSLRFAAADRELAERKIRERSLQTQVEGMIGQSAKMQKIFALMKKVAPSDVQVLILGESGTGKEVMAGAIHRLSPRKDQPFVAINCAAIPEALLESELFGHEKGAFTGAHAQRIGRIEMAEGGTLFLDEIGELPSPLQVKLLRFLQERTFERIGGRVSLKANVRLVSATNADLNKAMRENRFREDLYYRLAVLTAVLPPLRERMEDVVLLAKAFLRRVAEEEGKGKEKLSFSVPALRALERHSWPGNVRELLNRVKRAVIMAEGRSIKPADLDLGDGGAGGFRTLKEARELVEKEMAMEALQRHGGNISRVAEELGVSRPALYELLGRFGMKP